MSAEPGRSGVPIVRHGRILRADLPDEYDDKEALLFTEELGHAITATGAKGVVLDVSRLEVIDSLTARLLAETAAVTRVLGAEVVVAGMRATAAVTLAELGLGLPGLRTALSVEHALTVLERDRPGGGHA